METERQAEYPRIMFACGGLATVYREEYLGQGKSGLLLLPEEVAVLRSRLATQMEENWEPSSLLAQEGGKVFPGVYPKDSIVKLSADPNMPRWFCTYSITGEREIFNEKNMDAFQVLVSKSMRLQQQHQMDMKYIAKLEARINQLVAMVAKKVETDKRLFPQQLQAYRLEDVRQAMEKEGRK